MEFGRQEDFHGNIKIRLLSIQRAIAQYQFTAKQLRSRFENKLDENVSLFIKGFGNEVNFLSSFRELFFNSRELLDNLLIRINSETKGQSFQTTKEFLPFVKQLMKGNYDQSNLEIIKFLKTNITYIFHVRKIRNEIKNKPSNIKFRFVTDHFEAYFEVPILKEEIDLIPFLDINNKDEALLKRSYHITLNLDEFFPEMFLFWNTSLSILEKDFSGRSMRK